MRSAQECGAHVATLQSASQLSCTFLLLECAVFVFSIPAREHHPGVFYQLFSLLLMIILLNDAIGFVLLLLW
jgi:hypothetical protein